VYRHSAAALSIFADPSVTELKSPEQWRGEQAALAERAFSGVLRIDAAAVVPHSGKLVPAFVARFAFQQPVLAQAFVPVLVAAVLPGQGQDDDDDDDDDDRVIGSGGKSGKSGESGRNCVAQRAAIAQAIAEHAAREPATFRAACRALVAAAEAEKSGAAAANAACRLLAKVVSRSCTPGGGVDNDQDNDEETAAAASNGARRVPAQPFTAAEEGEVAAALESVQRWMQGVTATAATASASAAQDGPSDDDNDDDDENAAPTSSNRRAAAAPAAARKKKNKKATTTTAAAMAAPITPAARLVAHFGGRVAADVAARLYGAVTATTRTA
jgi:hypothetical protein